MPDYTENYNLKKPLANENYNIEDFNTNADIIDAELKNVNDKISEIRNDINNLDIPVTSVNNKTGDIVLTAADVGAETPEGAQAKANAAEQNAKNYADSIKPTKLSQLSNDVGYITTQRAVSDSVTSTSSTTAASSKAVKIAYDKAVVALNTANSKLGKTEKATDSDKLDGWHRDQIRDWNNLLNKPTHLPANGGNADSVDGLHFREYNGRLQYYYGGKWKDVMTSPIKSIQRGITDVSNCGITGINVTINSVDISKSILIMNDDAHTHVNTNGARYGNAIIGELTSNTNIKFSSKSGTSYGRVSWQVIEFI
ncbi:tail fiber protein [Caminicella sporogenes]|uniref:tail fiber protein n=1 Tax=Caminicella sporogenes TaxID=166485 RepID=UPI0025403021|nr:tail fiber protein [Caminicella sporogenes]WIF95112.1 tail fiber protein [Caminicella sporogenes]